MDIWKYYGITHRDHLICNPTSERKLDELVALLRLEPEARVLDVACGKAELLCRIAERHGVTGVGIDLSPYEVRAAQARIRERGLAERVELIEGDGRAYEPPPGSFDAALCIGATWIWDGYRGTLEALSARVRSGGFVAVGEPFKLREPAPDRLEQAPDYFASLASHADNVAAGVELGLSALYTVVSSPDDWDRYLGLTWYAAESYATEHPEDPDVPSLLERARVERDRYLAFERDTVGWAIYLFRR